MQVLDVYAGPQAIKRIKAEGFSASLFDYMLGASGGPKWFILAGLDRVLPRFMSSAAKPIHLMGSSAGAFRMACYGQKDPLAAINRLAEHYSGTVYSAKPSVAEISSKARDLVSYVLSDNGAAEIIANPQLKAHFVVALCKGLARFERTSLQMLGLIGSASANALTRRYLGRFFERVIFDAPESELIIQDPYKLPTHRCALTPENLREALIASGSIPLVLEGIANIPGAPAGMYRDGGIVDYHFDLQLGPKDGLVLYPHFYSTPIPGWFDKQLRGRKVHQASYDNVVMLVPSAEFVASLPYAKIPDRKDFETLTPEQRIPYWHKVIAESDRMGEAFLALAETPEKMLAQIKPLPFGTI